MLKFSMFLHNHHPSGVKMLAKFIRRGIRVYQNRERFGFSYIVIFQGAMESFAPVAQRLAGR